MKKLSISIFLAFSSVVVGNSTIALAEEINGKDSSIEFFNEALESEDSKVESIEEENLVSELNEEIKENIEVISEEINERSVNEEIIIKSGWNIENGANYFYKDGYKLTGWYLDSYNDYYFLDKETGEMSTGWTFDGYDWYYMNPSNGVMQKGWIHIDGQDYYLNPENGVLQYGWVFDGYDWYYASYDNGATTRGWKDIGDNKYYFDETTGVMYTGWSTINEKLYYFNNDGSYYEGNNIVEEAYRHIGKPYVSGAVGPNAFDCSGFTRYVHKQNGYNISRTTYTQINDGVAVAFSDMLPGDIIFTSSSHVGIYIGDGKMIHAPRTGETIKVAKVYNYYAARRIVQ